MPPLFCIASDGDFYEDLYSKFTIDPQLIDPSWKEVFRDIEQTIPFQNKTKNHINIVDCNLFRLIEAYRSFGYLFASMNKEASDAAFKDLLAIEKFGFTKEDLEKTFFTFRVMQEEKAPLKDILKFLQNTYCSSIGFEFKGVKDKEQELWFEGIIERTKGNFSLTNEEKQNLYKSLSKAELFENFLHTKFVGQTRFSLEGAETFIPLLNTLIEEAGDNGIENCQIGMPHRGRINALVNTLNKSYEEVFHEFEDVLNPLSFLISGDVKYHKSFSSLITTSKGNSINLNLIGNPSHLESVSPVTEGATKALQVKKLDYNCKKNLSIIIHGDSAIAGQGIVYENLQLQRLEGYSTGGSLHIVVNNKIGFTTLPNEYMSTSFCTDIAKAFDCPVLHVDAEDPESAIIAAKIAFAYRTNFSKDIFINLNCYRKYGHNEGDEPFFTQPKIYSKIKLKKSIQQIYLDKLIRESIFTQTDKEAFEAKFKHDIQEILQKVKVINSEYKQTHTLKYINDEVSNNLFEPVNTAISVELLKLLIEKCSFIPPQLNLHKKIQELLDKRIKSLTKMPHEKVFEWAFAETLAFASLLWQKIPIRLSGEDCRRGTFSHRHSVFIDQVNEDKYFPLNNLKEDQAHLSVYDSPLSEFAVLGFEYGYSLYYLDSLVIWEAQYGDFVNEAQVIIDEYIMAGEQRWAKPSRLTLFLPHGFEGQGPEHSSAKVERFLQLSTSSNVIVVNPTTPAQLFHLLRRQMLSTWIKPLIVFTPKGLLRNPSCLSSLDDFTLGSFQEVIDDNFRPKQPKKLIFCTGRVYYDLYQERIKRGKEELVAIIRIEQLHPLHVDKIKRILDCYEDIKDFYWVQEEPKNMGAWTHIKDTLEPLLGNDKKLNYIGRKAKATPAVGSYAVHYIEYERLMNDVFKD
jgi:2-oxoglutarate dehydrogenase E1 component